ncbi:phage terminase large subunit family protein [Methylobacillus sp. Pita2]|uniref:phage terminase large subunit family protein n=1 Tax=Methylobacillus sp. Pita2 TaxID=3383245 RepID=UPI0038B621E0
MTTLAQPYSSLLDTTQSVRALIKRLTQILQPPEQISTEDWSRKYRRLSAKATALPGRYNPDLTPWVKYMMAALDDPAVHTVVSMKSAQVGWTDGVVNNYIGKRIDVDPCPMIVMFAKEGAAGMYNVEKFTPMVEVTPRLAAKIPVDKTRSKDNTALMKQFPGGFLKLVGSNSEASVKSTPAPVVFVEEPDDCNANIGGQGDTISMLVERTKTYARHKIVYGGTPTIKTASRIEAAYNGSDKQVFMVPCHHCGESHVLAWQYVRWDTREDLNHEIYGKADPESAYYVCPHCGGIWNDADKRRNVARLYPVATAPFYGARGFYINELYSPFPGSRLAELVKKRLAADHALAQGDDFKMRVFINSNLGLPYEYQSGMPELDELRKRLLMSYPEKTVPWGGIVLTAGVDVQHDRVAVIIRAWGRGEESWLVYWGELYGQTMIPGQGVWPDLELLLFGTVEHAGGAKLRISAATIDSSDGQTSDAVYTFVRKHKRKHVMAGKGFSQDTGDREIYSLPRVPVDHKGQGSKQKASKYGLRPYMIGTQKAKDLILGADEKAGRVKLTGSGPGRMHVYEGVRDDYFEQLTSEVKAPAPRSRNRRVWLKKSGVRNEALDCEVMALHAARALKVHLYTEQRWDELEQAVRQPDIFAAAPQPDDEPDLEEDGAIDVEADGQTQDQAQAGGGTDLLTTHEKDKLNKPPRNGGNLPKRW